ncbi:NYN domain-containing protein [Phaeosphaeria sp. MPI-PUGE-AT-0046c]|nr:NYN domain-containing protein [Phaeosphaeria sp. MPI-PUGE-AT-0046c]
MSINNSSLALLIDGDNVSPKVIAGLLAEVANYGTASVKRIYGDWTRPNLNGWKQCLLNHSITPIQQFAYTTGKNATDGAMIIDAMDLLYTGRFSSFCIVSSDSDFTRLAARIREQGVTVYGFGERKTNNAFVAACDKFTYFDVLNVEAEEVEAPSANAMEVSKPTMVVHDPPRPRPIETAERNVIYLAIVNSAPHGDGWVNLATVGQYLRKIDSALHPRNYGYERLQEFLDASGIVETTYKSMGDKPPIVLARLKNNHKSKRESYTQNT